MYDLYIQTLDSDGEGFMIQDNFCEEYDAWLWWNDNSDHYPEMTGVWVEQQNIVTQFGEEAAANVMGTFDDSLVGF